MRGAGLVQCWRARRSACASQSLMAAIVSCRGGIPFGKSARRSASWSTPRLGRLGALVGAAATVLVRRVRVAAVLRAALRRLRAFWEVPATPWIRARWAPSDAGRVNVLPHSGQISSLLAGLVAVVGFAGVARLRAPDRVGVAIPITLLRCWGLCAPPMHAHIVRTCDRRSSRNQHKADSRDWFGGGQWSHWPYLASAAAVGVVGSRVVGRAGLVAGLDECDLDAGLSGSGVGPSKRRNDLRVAATGVSAVQRRLVSVARGLLDARLGTPAGSRSRSLWQTALFG
jgi:hypothetical protein